jgi:uncharacterized membrane protein YfcA
MTWQLVLTGLFIGMLVGLTGMGGGSLMTPLLVILFGYNPSVAVGTDLLHGAVFKSVGAIRHRRLGTVQAQLSGWMFVGSGPMSLLGVATASWLQHRYGDGVQSVQATILGVALLLGGVGLLAKSVLRFRENVSDPFVLTRRDRIAAVLIGLGGGFVVGLTSVGSGVFFGLTMLIVFPLRSSKVVGTDILHAAALLWVAGLGHYIAGNVDVHAVAWLLVGSIPGVLLSSGLTLKLPDATLRAALAITLLASGVKLTNVPHSDEIAIGVVAVGLFAAATARLLRLTKSRPAFESAPLVALPSPAREGDLVQASGESRKHDDYGHEREGDLGSLDDPAPEISADRNEEPGRGLSSRSRPVLNVYEEG